MTVKEAARRLQISASLLYKLIAEGTMPCRRIGLKGRRGKIILLEEDIQTFLEGARTARGTGA